MFTDPDHLRVEDPGKVEGNPVFTYLDAFVCNEHFSEFWNDYSCLDEVKEHYRKGGLGDVKIKKFLNNVLQEELAPIRERRETFRKDLAAVYQILIEGTKKAREKAAATTQSVRSAMKINYFEGM